MNTRVTSLVVDHLSALLGQVFHFDGPADAVMSRYFKQHPKLGQRDRGLIAEATFHALRRFATLGWILQPAHATRAPRLAALVTLARQHGLASLDTRALRGDERAVRSALGIELAHAPGSIRAEVPHWLFQRVTAQYHDAEPLLAALARRDRLTVGQARRLYGIVLFQQATQAVTDGRIEAAA
jgi:16S rRNA (cytosine967-C5)-methyltransferase